MCPRVSHSPSSAKWPSVSSSTTTPSTRPSALLQSPHLFPAPSRVVELMRTSQIVRVQQSGWLIRFHGTRGLRPRLPAERRRRLRLEQSHEGGLLHEERRVPRCVAGIRIDKHIRNSIVIFLFLIAKGVAFRGVDGAPHPAFTLCSASQKVKVSLKPPFRYNGPGTTPQRLRPSGVYLSPPLPSHLNL